MLIQRLLHILLLLSVLCAQSLHVSAAAVEQAAHHHGAGEASAAEDTAADQSLDGFPDTPAPRHAGDATHCHVLTLPVDIGVSGGLVVHLSVAPSSHHRLASRALEPPVFPPKA